MNEAGDNLLSVSISNELMNVGNLCALILELNNITGEHPSTIWDIGTLVIICYMNGINVLCSV